MRGLFWCVLVVSACLNAVLAKDYVCPDGKSSKAIILNTGDSYTYKPSPNTNYYNTMNCRVNYKAGTCTAAEVSCTNFNIKSNTACTRGDYLEITTNGVNQRFCSTIPPNNYAVSTTFSLRFFAGKSKNGPSFTCTIRCTSGSGVTTVTSSPPVTTPGVTVPSSRTGVAGLVYSFSPEEYKSPFCAGVLICSNWVLTSASCSIAHDSQLDATKVKVVLGALNLNDVTNKVVLVSKILKHTSFSGQSSSEMNNIALWKLSESVETTTYTPACLASEATDVSGEKSLVGWRMSDLVGSLNANLTELILPADSSAGCDSNKLCSSAVQCKGDFGSPLMKENTVIGLNSVSLSCANNQNTIFTKVSDYKTWIEGKISANGGCQLC